MNTRTDEQWQKAQYANLIRYKPSKTYFARIRIGGKLIRRSLSTSKMHALHPRLPETPYLHGKFPYFAPAPKTVHFGRLLVRTPNSPLVARRNAKRPANTGFFFRIEVAHALWRPVP